MSSKDTLHFPDMTGQTIDNGRYKLEQKIGSGGFGVVYRATFTRHRNAAGSSTAHLTKNSKTRGSENIIDKILPLTLAVKMLPSTGGRTSRARREAILHNKASEHLGVVLLYDFIVTPRYSYMIMDYCPGGNLSSKIHGRNPKTGALTYWREDALVKSVFLQIVDCLASVHRNGVYHRDLKPENILCNASGTKVYITDFGLATDRSTSTMHGCGTSAYMSPECIGEGRHAQKAYRNSTNDTWALGVILFNMLTAHLPWVKALSEEKFFHAFLHTRDTIAHFQRSVPLSYEAAELFQSMFDPSPSRRPTLTKLRRMIEKIETFWMTDDEIANGSSAVKKVVVHCSGVDLQAVPPPAPSVPKPKREADVRVEKWLKDMEMVPSSSWCNNDPPIAHAKESRRGDTFPPQWTSPAPAPDGSCTTGSSALSSRGPITPEQAPVAGVGMNGKGEGDVGIDDPLSALELNAASF